MKRTTRYAVAGIEFALFGLAGCKRFINVNIAAQNLKKTLDKSNLIWYNPIIK